MHTAKILISIVILIALVIGASSYTYSTLDNTSKLLGSHIEKIENSVAKSNWTAASQELANFEAVWSKTGRTWEMLLDHIEIDNIDTSLSKLSKYIQAQDRPLAVGEAASLKQFIEHIPAKEKLTLNNIF